MTTVTPRHIGSPMRPIAFEFLNRLRDLAAARRHATGNDAFRMSAEAFLPDNLDAPAIIRISCFDDDGVWSFDDPASYAEQKMHVERLAAEFNVAFPFPSDVSGLCNGIDIYMTKTMVDMNAWNAEAAQADLDWIDAHLTAQFSRGAKT